MKRITVEQIYARIPKIACQRKCQECCGPIKCHGVEWERMRAASLVPLDVIGPNLTCPALHHGACAIYAVRPLICRLWGVVRKMACPWGCQPERWLTDSEAAALLAEMDKLSRGVVRGPKHENDAIRLTDEVA